MFSGKINIAAVDFKGDKLRIEKYPVFIGEYTGGTGDAMQFD